MKVLFITSYISPFSGVAALWRLVKGLEQTKTECFILTGNPEFKNTKVVNPNISRLIYGGSTLSKIVNKIANTTVLSLSEKNYMQIIKELSPDIVNFHWTHGKYYIPLNIIKSISEKVPSVWTMHDMWPLTGGCFYSYECQKYQKDCGGCPQKLNKLNIDFTRYVLRKKNNYYQRMDNVSLVAPSLWLKNIILKSNMKKYSVSHIPYGVDGNVLKPIDKGVARSILGLKEKDRVMLIFGKWNERKGFDLFVKAITMYYKTKKNNKNVVLLIAGNNSHNYLKYDIPSALNIVPIGLIQNEYFLRLAFSASDFFLMPTRADNLPSSILESLACGTPVISFDVGGIGEMVRHYETGYLARDMDCLDFMNGIRLLLENETLTEEMGKNCRKIAISEYNIQKQANNYTELFNNISK